jgi:hypothetical protein
MQLRLLLTVASLLLASVTVLKAQDHGHLNIGAVGTNPGDPLKFENGPDFAEETGYVNTLIFTNAGPYSGYFVGNITLTGLAATEDRGGPIPGAAALGSRLFVQIAAVSGPPGGAFGFWDSGATSPTISVESGATSTNLWRLSENDGSPGSDPYGHIHGRRFTASRPGIYVVTFRAFDLSTNGLNGNPIHAPSEPLQISFQAGINIRSVIPSNDTTVISFGAKAGSSWQVESTDSLAEPNWTEVGEPVFGSDHFIEVIDPATATGPQRFYRVREELLP